MRFSNEVYDKLFPRTVAKEVVETAVPTFTPTTDKIEEQGVDNVAEVSSVVSTEEVLDTEESLVD